MATKKSTSTAVQKWDEELAKRAQIAAKVEESTATGQFFSLKGGVLTFNDAPMPGNMMGCIVLDSVLENVYYEGDYDPDNIQGPKCFAFGRDEKTMEPHKIVTEANNQMCGSSGLCQGCDMNEWGSADKGRGKACRNTRRLGIIGAGTFDNGKFKPFTDSEQFESGAVGYMKLPVTSVKGYAAYIKQLAGALKRPPFAVYTKIAVVPDPSTQFKVTFEPIAQVPDELLGIIMKRVDEVEASIMFPYTPFDESEKPAPKRGGKAAPPARGKTAQATRGARQTAKRY